MSRRFVALVLASGLLLGFLAGERLASAQGMRPSSSNAPVPSFDLDELAVVEEGSHLFRANCTHYQRIAKRLPPMPAFETVLPPETIRKIVAYVLSLSNAKDD